MSDRVTVRLSDCPTVSFTGHSDPAGHPHLQLLDQQHQVVQGGPRHVAQQVLEARLWGDVGAKAVDGSEDGGPDREARL